jgi:peroxiredoxin family protein
MSHTAEPQSPPPAPAAPGSAPGQAGVDEEALRRIVRDEVQRALARDPGMRRGAIIASKGTLDWAYPPLILGNAAAAMGMDVAVFFTFYGLNIIHKDSARLLRVDPVGNPAMPMPVPVPDLVSSLPGMVPLASRLMRAKFRRKNVASVQDLIETARDAGVRFIACQMTVDVFGYSPGDFVEGVEFGGAAAFMGEARRAHLTLFV